MDRNRAIQHPKIDKHESLSVRRAWIEIGAKAEKTQYQAVALRKESVDRNSHRAVNVQSPTSRSP